MFAVVQTGTTAVTTTAIPDDRATVLYAWWMVGHVASYYSLITKRFLYC